MMKTCYGFLAALVLCIGIAQCSNTTAVEPSGRVAYSCYYCANCPRPWNQYSTSVSQVATNTGWCAMMSTTASPSGIFTRGAAQPGLCYSNGCSWQIVGGTQTWVCCCNQNLCNAATSATTTYRPASTTTYRPVGTTCYYCSNCPIPFNRYSTFVTDTYSASGWCAKMSSSSSRDAIATRGAAPAGLCNSRGCSWKPIGGVSTWVCCCSGYHCNTAVSTKKSTIGLLSAALLMMFVARKNL